MKSPLRRVFWILAAMTTVLAAGTTAFVLVEGWSAFDALFMTLITLSTVGYGETHPLTPSGRVVAMLVIVTGVSVFLVSFGVIADLVVRLELTDYFGNRRRERMLEKLTGHYIVCGAGRVGRSVISELVRSGSTVVLIDNDQKRAQWSIDQGIPTLVSDATQDSTLRQARIEDAKGLVAAIGSDAENVYVTLSARVLNPDLVISARASDEQAQEKLRRAGANTVFTPYAFVGHRLAQAMLRPHVLNFLDVASAFTEAGEMNLIAEQIHVETGSALAHRRLSELGINQSFGVILLAVQKQSGAMTFNPAGETRIEPGDVLIAIGERANLQKLEEQVAYPRG